MTANKVGGNHDVYTFYGIAPASIDKTTFLGDLNGFTYGGTFEGGLKADGEEGIDILENFNKSSETLDEKTKVEKEEFDLTQLETAIQAAIAAKEGRS